MIEPLHDGVSPGTLVIRTPRLQLRPLRPDDRAAFVRAHEASADFLAPWVPARPAGDTPDALFERELERMVAGAALGTQVRLAAFLPTGEIAGFFNLAEIVRGAFQNAYASWSVSAPAAGRGYATESVRALLDLAFAPAERGGLGLHRVQANIVPENARSMRLAERTGFRYEGLARRYLKIAGEWRDHRMYAQTVEEHVPGGAVLGASREGAVRRGHDPAI